VANDDAYRSSVQFGDQEFLHEIGGYGTADPLLKAAIREYGADIAKVVPKEELTFPWTMGESKTKYHNWFPTDDIFSRLGQDRFNLPSVISPSNPVGLKTDREALNDLWRHEYRHQGMDLARERQDRSLWRKGTDFLGQMYSAPLDYELQDIFNPGWDKYPSKFFGLTESRKQDDEEAFIRVLDMLYGKSKSYPPKALRFLKGTMAAQGLIDDPESWRDHFLEGDPNNYLNKFEAYLSGNP